MTQLHEILSVENDTKKEATRAISEAKSTFIKKPNHFLGQMKTTEMFDENEITPAPESVDVAETVMDKLAFVAKQFSPYIDVVYKKDIANQQAKADIIIDGVVVAADMPATFLLGLESKLESFIDLLKAAPTLPPGMDWIFRGENIYRTATPRETFVTRKLPRATVLYEATEHHPAQVERWNEDVRVGRNTVVHSSGMLSVEGKSVLLYRANQVMFAVRQARQRANTQHVVHDHVAMHIFNYILD